MSGFANTYSDGGLVGLAASTNNADVESAFAALAGALRAGNITDEEVARAKSVLAGNAAAAADSQQGRAQTYVDAGAAGVASAADIAVRAISVQALAAHCSTLRSLLV